MDIFITSIISLIVGIVVARYAFFSNRVHKLEVMVATLKASKSELENKIANHATEKAEFKQQILDCEVDNEKIKFNLIQYENRAAILADYTFDYSFGFWRHNSNPQNILCEPCIKKNPPVQVQIVHFGSTEFKCKVCKEHYRNELI